MQKVRIICCLRQKMSSCSLQVVHKHSVFGSFKLLILINIYLLDVCLFTITGLPEGLT